MVGPLYESMIPQDRRPAVAALARAAAVQCIVRKRFYAYAEANGLVAACDYLDAQAGTDADARALLRAEIADIIEGLA